MTFLLLRHQAINNRTTHKLSSLGVIPECACLILPLKSANIAVKISIFWDIPSCAELIKHYTMKTYVGVDVFVDTRFLDLAASWNSHLHLPAAVPPVKESPVLIEWTAWCTPEPVWTLWSRDKYLASAGNRTLTILSSSR
jgi:hypothetical protein